MFGKYFVKTMDQESETQTTWGFFFRSDTQPFRSGGYSRCSSGYTHRSGSYPSRDVGYSNREGRFSHNNGSHSSNGGATSDLQPQPGTSHQGSGQELNSF